jgi:hypothetical protein
VTSQQAAEALAKARDLTRRAERNRRKADKMPGTRTAHDCDIRADLQSEEATVLFDQVAAFLDQA